MYELSLAPGIKVSQIVSLSNDIARSLKAPAVRVVAPIPGKNTIGIEVPNIDKENVRLKELLTMAGNRPAKMQLPLFLGKDAGGNPLIADLAKMPHMLIAGTTGSGKSVCLNSIVMSLLMTQRPDLVKMILVDPKMVEMSMFKDLPHLMCPIVTDMCRAEMILDWAVTKMDERYELLAEAGVRNIAAYNQMTREQLDEVFKPTSEDERSKIPHPLPHIIIIIDELADLMMTSAKEVEHHLSRLAQKSRAVGVHIVVATQRPEAKVVTGLIKSNLPCRVAFRVASRMDSRIVLDQNGAEVLMGQGDMLFLPPGSSKLVRAQGTYVSDDELRKAIEFLAEQTEPEYHPELINIGNAGAVSNGERDPLFDEAARIIIESGRGSVSLLQRRLTIGYGRASRLIDQMGEAGIVGPYKGSQAREVVVTLDEWEELKSKQTIEPQIHLPGIGEDDEPADDDL
jgi:S-DNA-T family DNA segregation ATPase FtsK/SpoIIIE